MWCISTAIYCLLAGFLPAANRTPFFLQSGQRVLFLGDSNTFAGHYIAYIDAYLYTRFPDQKFELINLGLPSETVSGLSEPDHPYPRPSVHERLERALTMVRPDVVVACYGMNDGIYYPFGEDRFKKYQQGIRRLIDRVKKDRIPLVLITSPPFDPQPVRTVSLPASAGKFSWVHPYGGYDDVLTRYAQWLLTLRNEGLLVVDAHGAINQYLAVVRKTEPNYRVSDDGVHGNATGHWPIARELLLAWHAPSEVAIGAINTANQTARGTIKDLSIDGGTVRFTWHTRIPMPFDPAWDQQLRAYENISATLNQLRLQIAGLPAGRYQLFENDMSLAMVKGQDLATGLDLVHVKELTTSRRSAEIWKLVDQRDRLLGLAWLTAVGHKRPNTPVGLPLPEARRQAADLDARIRKLAHPVTLRLRLSPAVP